jgi:hypothetical protein
MTRIGSIHSGSLASGAILIAVLLAAAGCARFGAGSADAVSETGMLVVVSADECPAAQGCGPELLLMNEAFDTTVPLLGEIDPSLEGQLVTVHGRLAALPVDLIDTPAYRGPDNGIRVRAYEVVSSLKYRSFLVGAARDYTESRYGCDLLWDKSFRWELADSKPHLIVRMTDVLSGRAQAPYLELRFDANSGDFIGEKSEPPGLDPCRPG